MYILYRGLSTLLVSDMWARSKPLNVRRVASKIPRFLFLYGFTINNQYKNIAFGDWHLNHNKMDLISIICSSISTKDWLKGILSVAVIGAAISITIAIVQNISENEPVGCAAFVTGLLIGIGILFWFLNWLWDWGLIG